MKHDEAVKILDELENCLLRAETARKDIDLLVALRVLYKIIKEKINEDAKRLYAGYQQDTD